MTLYKVGHTVSRIFYNVGFGRHTEGTHHIPTHGPAIVAANHMSYHDPPFLASSIKRPVHFMAKAELFSIPVLGFILRNVNVFPVHRGAADRQAIKRAFRILEEGKILALFPEGTRNREGTLQKPRRGISLIALRSNVPVIPVGIVGTSSLDRKKHGGKRPKIIVSFGEPVDLSEWRSSSIGKEQHVAASEHIMQAIAKQMEIARHIQRKGG